MGALAGTGEVVAGAAKHDLLAEGEEQVEALPEAEKSRLAAVKGEHVDAERGLQRGETVEVVEHDFWGGVALELDDDAHAGAIALVANVADAVERFGADQFGRAFEQSGFVDLVGDLGDDDRGSVAADFLDAGASPDGDGATAGFKGLADAGAAENDAAGGEVGARHDLEQILQREVGVGDQGQGGVDDLGGVVGRDVGRHADGDALAAVDQQVWVGGGQDGGFLLVLVVVGLEIDGVAIDVVEQEHRGARQTGLGVAHRRRTIAVDGAEIALAIDERDTHRPGLGEANRGVVDRGVAVRVVFAHRVADDAGGLAVGLVGGEAAFPGGVENAPMDGLEAVARVGQRTADDHRHRVGEVGGAHLLLDGHGRAVGGWLGVAHGQARGGVAIWGTLGFRGQLVGSAPSIGGEGLRNGHATVMSQNGALHNCLLTLGGTGLFCALQHFPDLKGSSDVTLSGLRIHPYRLDVGPHRVVPVGARHHRRRGGRATGAVPCTPGTQCLQRSSACRSRHQPGGHSVGRGRQLRALSYSASSGARSTDTRSVCRPPPRMTPNSGLTSE